MKLVIFGLTLSSSWGNGHATLWRGLLRALARHGYRIVFFERDLPYYAAHRDLRELPGTDLCLYASWEEALTVARREVADADAALVTSYCPDGVLASDLVLSTSGPLTIFYDLDTPVTLERLRRGEGVPYLPAEGLGGFDLVLSYTGGTALDELYQRLGARRVAPLYGSVDPEAHRPAAPESRFQGDLSYLGTYAADRQEALDRLFLSPARRLPRQHFVLGGAQYPADFPWADNVWFFRHLPPASHPAFFASSRPTLSVTRAAMARMGHCPSGRLFEAAACGTALLSDVWMGLDRFFTPGAEIFTAKSTDDVVGTLSLPDEEIVRVARAARGRHRAAEGGFRVPPRAHGSRQRHASSSTTAAASARPASATSSSRSRAAVRRPVPRPAVDPPGGAGADRSARHRLVSGGRPLPPAHGCALLPTLPGGASTRGSPAAAWRWAYAPARPTSTWGRSTATARRSNSWSAASPHPSLQAPATPR